MTPEITYHLTVEMEETPVRGNAMASGDGALDAKVEDEILARLNAGDVWAWADVTVTAKVTFEGEVFTARASLGCCSYRDEAEFMADGVYDDMCKEAREELILEMRNQVKRGLIATRGLAALFGTKEVIVCL